MKRSSGERAATIAASPRGSGARSAAHALRGERERVAGQRDRRGRGQALELIGAQLAQAAEVRDAEVLADADERDALGGHAQLGEPGQDLGDLQLVVEVGLEPQHVLAVAAGGERGVALLEARATAARRGSCARTARSSASPTSGTGPSCSTSRHTTTRSTSVVCSSECAVESPLVTCSVPASDGGRASSCSRAAV